MVLLQPLGSQNHGGKHDSHMGSKTMAGTHHDGHVGSQSMEKQPTGSSSLLQTEQQHSHWALARHCGFFPFCSGRLLLGLATLEPSLFGLRLGLGHGLLGLALALVGVALALHGSWLGLGSWLLGCRLGFGLLELVLEPAHGAWSHPAEGNPQLPHGLCSGPRYPTAKVGPGPHLAGTQPWLHWQLASSWCQLASSWAWLLALRRRVGLGLRTGVDRVAACREEMVP